MDRKMNICGYSYNSNKVLKMYIWVCVCVCVCICKCVGYVCGRLPTRVGECLLEDLFRIINEFHLMDLTPNSPT